MGNSESVGRFWPFTLNPDNTVMLQGYLCLTEVRYVGLFLFTVMWRNVPRAMVLNLTFKMKVSTTMVASWVLINKKDH